MKILNILLPNTLPIARSTAPLFIAKPVITISGREVAKTINMFPIKVCPSPVISASFSPILGSRVAAIIIIIAFKIIFYYYRF